MLLVSALKVHPVYYYVIRFDVFSVAPRFVVPLKTPITANAGESITIDCVVQGDPEPTIQWDKDLKMSDFDLSRYSFLLSLNLLLNHFPLYVLLEFNNFSFFIRFVFSGCLNNYLENNVNRTAWFLLDYQQ